jgi:hypothetical protein
MTALLEPMFEQVASVSTDAELRAILAESGMRPETRERTPEQLKELAEVGKFLTEVVRGKRRSYALEEAMGNPRFSARLTDLYRLVARGIYSTWPVQNLQVQETLTTSDFPILMGDTLDRQLLGQYQEWPLTWPNIARRGTVRDFRTVRRITMDGLDDRWYPDYDKPEMHAVQENNNLVEGQYTYAVTVYERGFALNWRMFVNDDIDAFANLPMRLARGARRSEEYFATSLYVDANGPHASLYTAGNANIINIANGAVANNPPLSIAGLQDGITVLMSQTDANGEPIMVDVVELVVPPALAVIANNILNATQLVMGGLGQTGGGGVAAQQVITMNWMRQKVRINVNPYIPVIAASANGNTSWFLFANPNSQRPALEVGFLRGYETPGIFQKAPNTMRVGGAIDPMLGDFETDELRFKGRHIFGGTRMDGKLTVASNGSGS